MCVLNFLLTTFKQNGSRRLNIKGLDDVVKCDLISFFQVKKNMYDIEHLLK